MSVAAGRALISNHFDYSNRRIFLVLYLFSSPSKGAAIWKLSHDQNADLKLVVTSTGCVLWFGWWVHDLSFFESLYALNTVCQVGSQVQLLLSWKEMKHSCDVLCSWSRVAGLATMLLDPATSLCLGTSTTHLVPLYWFCKTASAS